MGSTAEAVTAKDTLGACMLILRVQQPCFHLDSTLPFNQADVESY